MLVNMLVS